MSEIVVETCEDILQDMCFICEKAVAVKRVVLEGESCTGHMVGLRRKVCSGCLDDVRAGKYEMCPLSHELIPAGTSMSMEEAKRRNDEAVVEAEKIRDAAMRQAERNFYLSVRSNY